MACYEKYKSNSVSMMLNHYDRHEEELRQRGNDAIDMSRTHLNYSLLEADGEAKKTAYERYKERLSEVYRSPRADVNTLVDCVVTLPKDVPEDRSKEFFQTVFEFLCDQHGRQNVIAAAVHMDETTPHLHFAFIPVVPDEKHGYKVCAKDAVSHRYLWQFHKKLHLFVEKRMGMPVSILNGATLGGNKSVLELKIEQKRAELQDLELKITEREMELDMTNQLGEMKRLFLEASRNLSSLNEHWRNKKFFGPSEKAKMQDAISYSESAGKLLDDVSQMAQTMRSEIRKQTERYLSKCNQIYDERYSELSTHQKAATEKESRLEDEIEKRVQEAVARRARELDSREKELLQREQLLRKQEEVSKKREALRRKKMDDSTLGSFRVAYQERSTEV